MTTTPQYQRDGQTFTAVEPPNPTDGMAEVHKEISDAATMAGWTPAETLVVFWLGVEAWKAARKVAPKNHEN